MALGLLPEILFRGLLTGGMLALMAIGLTLIFGVMDLVNFAHGHFIMLGMYMTHFLYTLYGVDPFLALFLVGPAFFLVGVATHKVVFEPILGEGLFVQVFMTLGLLWVLENGVMVIWGPEFRDTTASYSGIDLFGLPVGEARLYGFVIAMVLVALLYVFLYRTKTGLGVRATAQSRDLASSSGIDIDRIYLLTVGLAIALAGVAGGIFAVVQPTNPTVGNRFVLTAFVIVAFGGLGSVTGALLAAFAIGILQALIGFYYEALLAPPVYFLVFIAVLVYRTTDLHDTINYRVAALANRVTST